MIVSWDTNKKAMKFILKDVVENSKLKIIWNSFKNLKYTAGRNDETEIKAGKGGTSAAWINDLYNMSNNPTQRYGAADGTVVTVTTTFGAQLLTKSNYTFFRKARYPDTTHRNLTCGKPLEFSWKGAPDQTAAEVNGTFWVEMNKDCTGIVSYSTAKPSNAPPDASFFQPKNSSTGFSCSMDGYTKMVTEITELAIIVISMYKEIWAAILPTNLALALKYAYAGLTGVSNWIGYAIAALYYLAEDQGFGDTLCEISGYGAVVIEALYKMIDFGTVTTTV